MSTMRPPRSDLHGPYKIALSLPRHYQTMNTSFFECTACLKDRNEKPGLDHDVFFNFPVASLLYAVGVLLNFGAWGGTIWLAGVYDDNFKFVARATVEPKHR